MSQLRALLRRDSACTVCHRNDCENKGITTGNLRSKIEEMANQQLIRPHIKAVADGIRDYGNEMAHGDFADPVAGADSALIIKLMGKILQEVYESPARLARVQQAVSARRQGGGQTWRNAARAAGNAKARGGPKTPLTCWGE